MKLHLGKNKPTQSYDSETLQEYQRIINTHPFFSHEECTKLFTELRAGEHFLDESTDTAEEKELLIKKRVKEIRNSLIVHNLGLVISIAKQFHSTLPLEDLVNEGIFGLERAITKFEVEKGFKFSTYASTWIYQAIQRSIMNTSRTIRLPNHVLELLAKCTKAQKGSGTEELSLDDLAQATKLSPDKIEELRYYEKNTSIAPLYVTTEESGDNEHPGIPLSPNKVEEEILKQEVLSKIYETFNKVEKMPHAEIIKSIITLNFGLESDKEHNMSQIAAQLGISRERVRQLKNQGMEILAEELRDFRN